MANARRYRFEVSLFAALAALACGDSMDAEPATETNVRRPPPSAAGASGTMGSDMSSDMAPSSAPPETPPTSTPPAQTPAPEAPSTETPPTAMPSSEMPTEPLAPEPFPGESCDGCVRFFVPMTGENQRGDFELELPAPIDMTGATLRFRLMTNAFAATAGGVSVYVRDAGNFDKGFVWTNLTALATWTEVAVDFTTMLGGNVSFDVTRVAKLGVQLNSAGTFTGATWQDATVYLDAVSVSNNPGADLAFSDGIGGFTLVSTDAPAGTSVGFIAP